MSFSEIYDRVLKEYPDILTVEEMSDALGVSTKQAINCSEKMKLNI